MIDYNYNDITIRLANRKVTAEELEALDEAVERIFVTEDYQIISVFRKSDTDN